jgi:hypothetical protein
MSTTIYVVEISHQMPVKTWTANGENEFVSLVQAAMDMVEVRDYDHAVEVLSSDLSGCYVYRGADEAREGLRYIAENQRHQVFAALRGLRRALVDEYEEVFASETRQEHHLLREYIDALEPGGSIAEETLTERVQSIAYYPDAYGNESMVIQVDGQLIFVPHTSEPFWSADDPSWDDLMAGDVDGWDNFPERVVFFEEAR